MMKSVEGYNVELLLQLMDAGHHFNNIPVNQRQVKHNASDDVLSCTSLLCTVVESNMTRPRVKHKK
jgi:hypothetical protein